MSDAMEMMRRELLAAALPHVTFDGWSRKTLLRAAADCDIEPARALIAFPDGARDLLTFFVRDTDRVMLQRLAEADLAAMRVRDRVGLAIRLRIEILTPHREAVRRALGASALPNHLPAAVAALSHSVDAIWAALGDRSVDFNFYSKRALLAGVYMSTLLYWLSDDSPDFAHTWSFLDRRIDNVMAIQKLSAGRAGAVLPSMLRLAGRLRYPGRSFRI